MTSPEQPAAQPGFRSWMGSMWLFTLLRFGLFGALWAVLSLTGMSVFLAGLLGLVLSVPLSFVLLARPRARVARQIELRMAARKVDNGELATQLDPDAQEEDRGLAATEAAKTAIVARRRKQRSRPSS